MMGAQIVDWSIRALLMAAATAAALLAFRIRIASTRHLAWTGVLAFMLLLPAWTAWGPKLRAPLLPAAPQQQAAEWSAPAADPLPAPSPASLVPAQPIPPPPAAERWNWRWFPPAVYLAGFGAMFTRLLAGTVRARRLARRAVSTGGLLSSAQCSAPLTTGWLRPVIILPAGWRQWPAAELDAVLTHEREHVRRRDPLVQWLALLNRAVFWFHPLAWWLERKLAALAEEACDAAVLRRGHDPHDYSEYLIDLARSVERAGSRVTVWGTAIGGSTLPERIRKMLDGRPAPAVSRIRAVLAAVVCGLTLAAFAACNLERAQRPAPGQLSMNEMMHRDAAERKKQSDALAALLEEAKAMTPEQAAAKVAALKANPADDRAYFQLMRHYEFRQDVPGKNALILWFIEHQPAGKVRPWNIDPALDRAAYEKGKLLWLAHLRRGTPSADIYERAASFFTGADKPLGEEALLAGRKAHPNDERWPRVLGTHYAQVLIGAAEPRTEYNVFRKVDPALATGPYAQSVRAKLAASNDAPLLAQTAQWLTAWGRGRTGALESDLLSLAESYANRALQLAPQSALAKSMKLRIEQAKNWERIREMAKLPPAERARLSDSDHLMLTLREMDLAMWKEQTPEGVAKANELLKIASQAAAGPQRSEAIYQANIALGKAALREGDKGAAVRYLLGAADAPFPADGRLGETVASTNVDMNLPRALIDWGERDAVADFLERMAPKTTREQEYRDWAAQIRRGINPDLRPLRAGCSKGPC